MWTNIFKLEASFWAIEDSQNKQKKSKVAHLELG